MIIVMLYQVQDQSTSVVCIVPLYMVIFDYLNLICLFQKISHLFLYLHHDNVLIKVKLAHTCVSELHYCC